MLSTCVSIFAASPLDLIMAPGALDCCCSGSPHTVASKAGCRRIAKKKQGHIHRGEDDHQVSLQNAILTSQ